jgi:two-component system sensor histidine kinase QseC
LTSSLTTIGNYFLDNLTIQHYFDKQLTQTVYFIRGLITSDPSSYYLQRLQKNISSILTDHESQYPDASKNKLPSGLDKMQFRVWNTKGQLLLQTPLAPKFNIHNKHFNFGFTTYTDKNAHWRILVSPATKDSKLIILIAERYELRSQLAHELTWGNLFMLLWSYPLFGLLIWLSIDRGLSSLKRITRNISSRRSTNFDTVDIRDVPLEVKPVVEALNKLFLRLNDTFIRNKRFSADAAHELRTPLAALKTQAQVALKAPDEDGKKQGLRNVILGVDRCTHIVQQLLILSRLAPEATLNDIRQFNITKLAAEVIAQLVPSAIKKDIEVELEETQRDVLLTGNETSLAILIRNLVDNAIRYTPEGGTVNIQIQHEHKQTIVKVTDSGPGIPEKLRSRVFERFYRVLGTKASGSGLGLAIVQQIAELHKAHITLGTPANNQGLEISVTFPDGVLEKHVDA